MSIQTIVCPLDGKDDSIQKVSSIVSSGTVGYGGTSMTMIPQNQGGMSLGIGFAGGKSSSKLAEVLSLPVIPKRVFTGAGCMPLLVLVFATMCIVLALKSLNDKPVGFNWSGQDIVLGLTCFVAPLLFLLFCLLFTQKKESVLKLKYAEEKAKWEVAVLRWERLYYCWKHDLVFDPETGETCNPAETVSFCYKSPLDRGSRTDFGEGPVI